MTLYPLIAPEITWGTPSHSAGSCYMHLVSGIKAYGGIVSSRVYTHLSLYAVGVSLLRPTPTVLFRLPCSLARRDARYAPAPASFLVRSRIRRDRTSWVSFFLESRDVLGSNCLEALGGDSGWPEVMDNECDWEW